MKKVKEEDFFFGEDTLIEIFGKERIEKLKKEDYARYVRLRNSPNFMPSDIIPPDEDEREELEEVKKYGGGIKKRNKKMLRSSRLLKRSMNKNVRKEVEELMEELHADSYERSEDWKGYEVYQPIHKKMIYLGYPFVVLVKGAEVRISEPEESLEHLEFINRFLPHDEDEYYDYDDEYEDNDDIDDVD